MPTRTELIWDGKYDAANRRTPVFRTALPFQTVETVNESAGERKSLFSALDREKPWRNRLIWGDKKYVLPSLLPEFAGKVNLIYIDPPFDTGADFSFNATIHDGPEDEDGGSFTKHPNIIEQKAYRDTWGRGIDSYLQWFYETAAILHELLSDNGSIYIHLDWHVVHYAKAVLDELFGAEHFINEIIWKRQSAKGDVTQGADHMGRIHDTLLYYSKSDTYTWNVQYTAYDQTYIDDFYRHRDSDGRRYRLSDITAPGKSKESKGNPHYEFLGITRYWRFSKERMAEMYKQGRIVQTNPGTVPAQKRYLDEIPPDDVPEEVRSKVTHWSQWIDFWAVDWHHGGDTFHNEWQAFRTKSEKKLPLTTEFTYEEAGDYKVMVKVIDILGNDTTKTLTVKVK